MVSIYLTKPAYAEVMDKEPSLIVNYIWGITGAILCFATARYKPWLLLLIAPLPLFYFAALITEINDPFVGKAILNEADSIYVISSYALCVFVIASISAGLWVRKNEKHNKSFKFAHKKRGLGLSKKRRAP